MKRYFLEVSYKGTRYAGFQIQENAVTVQWEVEKALRTYFRGQIDLTGSSRTDAGVHALQNFFHFDTEHAIPERALYNLNAILPPDIAIQKLVPVGNTAHARFDATAREYEYFIYQSKDPFLHDRAFFFPYTLDINLLHQAAAIVKQHTDFTSFAKRNSQVKTFNCSIIYSQWVERDGCLIYQVKANRFLRGMVRGLTATMLSVGRGRISLVDFQQIFEAKDCQKADFAVPGHGLFLLKVEYPEGYFESQAGEV